MFFQYSDELFVELFQFLHALYGKNIDTESVSHTFQFLEEHMLYPYIEELAHDAAQFELGSIMRQLFNIRIQHMFFKKLKGVWDRFCVNVFSV